ncbi:protein of unknown function [Methylocaldum szegediense]|uniref:Uncharacterized protein n=1 Tax=Methylocaldum szegediense TaxID=73780 RepID=A0ABN8X4H4_9GAMM|nr:protein of unknown function [Methylocaldum szegediense]
MEVGCGERSEPFADGFQYGVQLVLPDFLSPRLPFNEDENALRSEWGLQRWRYKNTKNGS